jgi:hypothetical protein
LTAIRHHEDNRGWIAKRIVDGIPWRGLAEFVAMIKQRYVYWQDDECWLGYLEEFPDYWTQGDSEADLKAHLIDLYKDLTSGSIPNVRRMAELDIA